MEFIGETSWATSLLRVCDVMELKLIETIKNGKGLMVCINMLDSLYNADTCLLEEVTTYTAIKLYWWQKKGLMATCRVERWRTEPMPFNNWSHLCCERQCKDAFVSQNVLERIVPRTISGTTSFCAHFYHRNGDWSPPSLDGNPVWFCFVVALYCASHF